MLLQIDISKNRGAQKEKKSKKKFGSKSCVSLQSGHCLEKSVTLGVKIFPKNQTENLNIAKWGPICISDFPIFYFQEKTSCNNQLVLCTVCTACITNV
jgi:hypothetical protein